MNEREKSDSPVLPTNPPKRATRVAAEVGEGRGLAEGNTDRPTRPGRSAGPGVTSGLDRVREVARKDSAPSTITSICEWLASPAPNTGFMEGIGPPISPMGGSPTLGYIVSAGRCATTGPRLPDGERCPRAGRVENLMSGSIGGGWQSRHLRRGRTSTARSSGGCNDVSVDLCGGAPAEDLAGPAVHLRSDGQQLLGGDQPEISALREVLGQQAVHVLVGGALPG